MFLGLIRLTLGIGDEGGAWGVADGHVSVESGRALPSEPGGSGPQMLLSWLRGGQGWGLLFGARELI